MFSTIREFTDILIRLSLFVTVLNMIIIGYKYLIHGGNKILTNYKETKTNIIKIMLMQIISIISFKLTAYYFSILMLILILFSAIKDMHDCFYLMSEKICSILFHKNY